MNPLKKQPKILKCELENLYFNKNMSLDQIGKHYGYYDRRPIMRLFRYYEIETKNHRKRKNHVIPPKEYIVEIFDKNDRNISKSSKSINVGRKQFSQWLKHHNIKTDYFVNSRIDNEWLKNEAKTKSLLEISNNINMTLTEIKRRIDCLPPKDFTKEEIKKNIQFLNLNSQGLGKQLKTADERIYDSLMTHTNNHVLSTNKITERLYRIANGYDKNHIDRCVKCSAVLKFYTFDNGYGNSNHNICNRCMLSVGGVSKSSQNLFDELYSKLTKNNIKECRYNNLNSEKIINVTKADRELLNNNEKLNKNRYVLDFTFNNKIIEYDGDFFHSDKEKEHIKDSFLKLKGYEILHISHKEYTNNKRETIQKCLAFLNQ